MNKHDALQTIGVGPDASVKDITKRFHALAKDERKHPDLGGDANEFAHIKLAYDVLIGRVEPTAPPEERVRDFTWDSDGVSVGWPAMPTSENADGTSADEAGAVTTEQPTTLQHASEHHWSRKRVVRTLLFALISPAIGVLYLLGVSVFVGRWPSSGRGVLVAVALCALAWVEFHFELTSAHGLGGLHICEWGPFVWLGLRLVGTRIGDA